MNAKILQKKLYWVFVYENLSKHLFIQRRLAMTMNILFLQQIVKYESKCANLHFCHSDLTNEPHYLLPALFFAFRIFFIFSNNFILRSIEARFSDHILIIWRTFPLGSFKETTFWAAKNTWIINLGMYVRVTNKIVF